MASGDTVYNQSGFSVYEADANYAVLHTYLNKGGSSSNTRQEITLNVFVSSPANNPFDLNKQYAVIIKEI